MISPDDYRASLLAIMRNQASTKEEFGDAFTAIMALDRYPLDACMDEEVARNSWMNSDDDYRAGIIRAADDREEFLSLLDCVDGPVADVAREGDGLDPDRDPIGFERWCKSHWMQP